MILTVCHDADGAGKVQCTLFAIGSTRLNRMSRRLPFSQLQRHSAGMYKVMRCVAEILGEMLLAATQQP